MQPWSPTQPDPDPGPGTGTRDPLASDRRDAAEEPLLPSAELQELQRHGDEPEPGSHGAGPDLAPWKEAKSGQADLGKAWKCGGWEVGAGWISDFVAWQLRISRRVGR